MKNRIGEENINTQGTLMRIIDYNRNDDIIVEFQDEYKYQIRSQYKEFKNGKIKNPYDKIVFGVGFIGDGIYTPYIKEERKKSETYKYWQRMLQRGYSEEFKDSFSSYREVKVCEEWHNFQNFAKWFEDNYYEVRELGKMQLDKDILNKGNKIYSPDNCIFVPMRINQLFIKSNGSRGELPIGVTRSGNKFRSRLHIIEGEKYLGSFNTPEEAFYAYKTFKEQYVKEVADEYKLYIPQKLYEAMYKYEVEITD